MVGPLALIDFLNSREDANLALGLVIFGYALFKSPGVIPQIAGTAWFVLSSKLALLYGAAFLYSAAVVYAASELGVWHAPALKATIYWFLVTAVILVGNAVTESPHGTALVKRVLPRIVGYSVLLGFVMSLYVLPFLAELFIVGVASTFAVLDVLARHDPTTDPAVQRFIDGVLATLGLTLFAYFVVRALSDLDGFLSRENAEELYVGPALSAALIPFLYATAWLSWRERHPRRKTERVTRADFGDSWPLTVDEAELRGRGSRGFGSVTIKVNGTEYSINGVAKGQHCFEAVDSIWADDPDTGAKKSMGPMIERGLKLCS